MPKLRLITHPITNETLSVTQWVDKLKISRSSLIKRLKKYPLEIALSPYYLSNKGEPMTTKTIQECKNRANKVLAPKPVIQCKISANEVLAPKPVTPSYLIEYYENEIPNFLELPIGTVKLTVRRYPKNTRISISIDGLKPLFMLWPTKYSNEDFANNTKQIYDKIRAYLLTLKI